MLRLYFMRYFLSPLLAVNNRLFRNSIIQRWQKRGMPLPAPHVVKQATIAKYQQKYQLSTLIETGTYLGDMVDAKKDKFKEIVSIELSPDLAKMAQKRFQNQPHISIVSGDSATSLKEITANLNNPALFWLDGHYSGGITAKGGTDCPIFGELDAIFSHNQNHIILIDDARYFIGEGDYPSIEGLSAYVTKFDTRYRIATENDVITVTC